MLTLSRTGIRNLASSDLAYSRGLQYYKSGRVSNVAYAKMSHQYRMNVKGNYDYSVSITEYEDGSFEHACNCPSHVKEKGACKHVVAALLFLLKYQEKSVMEMPQNPDEKRAYQILEYFSNQEEPRTQGEVFHLMATITLPSMLKNDTGQACLTLQGSNQSGRFYKIQTLKKFLGNYSSNENITLGKEFKFIAGESEFDKSSMRLLDYLLNILELQKIADTAVSSKLFAKSHLNLSGKLLISLLEVLEDSCFQLELYRKVYENVRFFKGNPGIRYELDVYEDAICLDYEQKEPIIPLMENGELLFYHNTIFQPDKRFLKNYVPFYNSLGGEKKPLVFRGNNKQRFLEEVLPRLHDTMEIGIPEELEGRYLDLGLEACIYFDKYNSSIKAELHFIYGEYEFNCFEDLRVSNYIVLRKKEQEYEIMHMLEQMDFEPHSSFYLLKNDGRIYDFLQGKMEGLEDLASRCKLYYSADFKKIGIRSGGKFRIGLRASSDIDLLEMDFAYEDISKEELQELFQSLCLKKKYYRMKDGSFLDLENENIRSIADMLDALNVPAKNLNGGPLRLSKSSAFYLDDVLKDSSFIVEKNDDFKKLVDKILSPETKEYELPGELTANLRPYQVTGFCWLKTLAENSLGGILADDMGLGKTLQSISYITSELREKGGKYLIVCPSSLIYNWQDEFETFSGKVRVAVCSGPPADRQAIIEAIDDTDVIITSYPLIRRDIVYYQNINFHTVFIDEAQFIKNAGSLNAQSVKLLQSEHRFALTGTPIENSLSELWSIFDFVMPNYLMSHSKFVVRYEKQIMKEDKAALEHLNRRIRPFILRRMKKDVLAELPEKIEDKILTDMTEEQRKIYVSYMSNIRSDLNMEITKNGIEKSRIKILAALTRLRQICCHPSTFISNYAGESGKLNLLMEVLADAVSNGHRILVFSQFTTMLQIIARELKKNNYPYFYLEGATSAASRIDYVKRFNGGEGDVFLISLKAGGTGLNLTGADTVIHYDPWWNPAVEDQATDRAYRIGQKNNVHVIRLLTRGTIEEKIFKLQKKKKELSDSVIQAKEVFINRLTREELEDILS